MKEEIKRLKALQEVDLEIGKIEKALAGGTEELQNQQESIEKHQADIAENTLKLEEGAVRQRELEAEVEDAQVMIKDRQTKLMKVQTNREYQSILKEIDDAKGANIQREDELVQLLERAELLEKQKAEQVTLCEEEEAQHKEAAAELAKESAELDAQMAKFQKSRATKVKKVKAALLRKYERIRGKRGGLAMVGVNRGVCHGCFMNVPPQLYNELLKEEQLHDCPACNRLLYNLPDSE